MTDALGYGLADSIWNQALAWMLCWWMVSLLYFSSMTDALCNGLVERIWNQSLARMICLMDGELAFLFLCDDCTLQWSGVYHLKSIPCTDGLLMDGEPVLLYFSSMTDALGNGLVNNLLESNTNQFLARMHCWWMALGLNYSYMADAFCNSLV